MPKLKPAPRKPVKRKPVVEPDMPSGDIQLYEQSSSTHIPPEIIKEIQRDFGFSLEFHARTAAGRAQTQVSRFRNGPGRWEQVRFGDFSGLTDFLAAPGAVDGDPIVVGDSGNELILEARPVAIQKAVRQAMRANASAPVVQIDHKYRTQGVDVSMPQGGKHPSALRHYANKSSKSYEAIPMPPPDYQPDEGPASE